VLARLARVFLVAVLLALWQAALEHPVEHASHEDSSFCDALDALTACAPGPAAAPVAQIQQYAAPLFIVGAPRVAQAPPFLSHAPPFTPEGHLSFNG
jgi:hypothetical protein